MDSSAPSFAELFVWAANKLDKVELRSFAALCWAAWYCRNYVVFDKGQPEAIQIATGFVRLVEESSSYAMRVGGNRGLGVPLRLSWVAPPRGVVKVNVDAYLGDNGGGGLGSVIRDDAGRVLVAGVHKFTARWCVAMAEAAAAMYGVSLARRFGFSRVILECDALNVVKAIANGQVGAAPIFLFYDDIAKTSRTFDSFSCVHVKRVGNTVAHCMARWDTIDTLECVFVDSPPQSISALAELDLVE